MAIVLEVSVTLNPNNQIAYLGDFTGLVVDTEYLINGTYITYDTRFTFRGNLDITLTKPPIAVPTSGTVVPAEITTVPEAAPPPLPVKYPFSAKDRLNAANLNIDFEFSPGPTPPNSALGGAGRYKYWVDTSLTPAVLRQCRVARAAITYVAAEWMTIGTIDTVNGIYNPAGGLTNGGTVSGSITITGNETITGNLSVGGTTNVNTLFANGTVYSTGPGAAFQFNDRTIAGHFWQWWAAGDYGHLDAYTPTGRQMFVINGTNGDVNVTGNLATSANFYASGDIHAVGALLSTGGVNSGVYFSDHSDGSYRYVMYGAGENLIFYNERHGWVLGYFDANGSLFVRSNLTCAQVSSTFLYTPGTVQGGYIVSTGTVHANADLTAGGNIGASGNISCSGSMWMWDVNSGGTVNSQYGSFSQNVNANGRIDASYIYSRGNMDLAGSFAAQGSVSCNGNVNCVYDVHANGYVYASRLAGGFNNSGTLLTWGGTNSLCFRWDSNRLSYRVDEAVETIILASNDGVTAIGIQGGTAGPTGVTCWVYAGGTSYGMFVDGISDARIKENITPTSVDALAVLKTLPVAEFDIKPDAAAWLGAVGQGSVLQREAAERATEPWHVPIGFIAQDVLPIMPEAVMVAPTQTPVEGSPLPPDMHTMALANMVPYLVKAVQQLAARVEQLELTP